MKSIVAGYDRPPPSASDSRAPDAGSSSSTVSILTASVSLRISRSRVWSIFSCNNSISSSAFTLIRYSFFAASRSMSCRRLWLIMMTGAASAPWNESARLRSERVRIRAPDRAHQVGRCPDAQDHALDDDEGPRSHDRGDRVRYPLLLSQERNRRWLIDILKPT